MYVWMDAHMYNWGPLSDQPVDPSDHREHANHGMLAVGVLSSPTRHAHHSNHDCRRTAHEMFANPFQQSHQFREPDLGVAACGLAVPVTHAYART